jgi:glutamine amidotransferase
MTSLFGCICNQPQRVGEALAPVRSLLVAAPPVARWGLAYVQSSEVLLSRTPRSSEDPVDFFEAVEQAPSDYVIGHASPADGLHGNANTQPFRFRRWMFAMEGVADQDQSVAPQLLEHVPEYLRRNIKGKTLAEHVFHVLLSFLHDAGALDDPHLDTHASRRALRDAFALVYGELTKIGGGRTSLGNAIVSNSRSMLALRLDAPLYLRRLKVPVSKRDTETFKGVLALSTAADPGEGFEEIPPRSVLCVGRDIRTDIASIDE